MDNIFILGAPKCGTTTLHSAIAKAILFNGLKEPVYFNTNIYNGEKRNIILDGNCRNLVMKFVPERIYETCGSNVKLIIITRNRLERAYSNWSMKTLYKRRYEHLSFEDAMLENLRSFDKNVFLTVKNRMASFDGKNDNTIRTYIEEGLYNHNRGFFYEYFDKNKILNISLDDLKNNYHNTILEVFNFLDIKNPIGEEVCLNKGFERTGNLIIHNEILDIWKKDENNSSI